MGGFFGQSIKTTTVADLYAPVMPIIYDATGNGTQPTLITGRSIVPNVANNNANASDLDPTSTTLFNGIGRANQNTSAVAGHVCGIYWHVQEARIILNSSGKQVGGFKSIFKFGYPSQFAGQSVYIGYQPIATIGSFTATPSNTLNLVGLIMDSTDSNFQFAWNNGAGAAKKVDTGISFASAINQELQLTMAMASTGAPLTMTFQSLEAGGFSVPVTIANADSKFPATDVQLEPMILSTNGAVASAAAQAVFSMSQQCNNYYP